MSKNHTKHRNRTKGFTMIPNAISYDQDLSLKGFGMLMKLLMLAEDPDWNFSKRGLVKVTGWGPTIVNTALAELESLGYLIMTQPRKENGNTGQFDKPHWHIFESPVQVNKATGEVTELNLPNAFEYPTLNQKSLVPEMGAPITEHPVSDFPIPVHQTQYNNITIEDVIISKNNNSQCYAPGDSATQNSLYNETGELDEALNESSLSVSTNPPVRLAQSETALNETERMVKQLKKKYKSAFVDYALELSQDKNDSISYAKTLLRDWKKQELKTIESVKRYVYSFEDEKTSIDLTVKSYQPKKFIRIEQTPEWLGQKPQPYNPHRQLTTEEQQTVERMKQMQSNLLNQYASKLPF